MNKNRKILFLTLHRPDRSPSQRFRFEQYLSYLQENGFDYDLSFLLNEKDDKVFYSPGKYFGKLIILVRSIWKRCVELSSAKKYDLIFVQREAFMLGTAYFEKKFARKAPLVFDFDDSIWLQNVSDANKIFGWLKNANKTKEIIKVAKMVFAGNQYLADYASTFNPQVKIVPTTIDTKEYLPAPENKRKSICIGWSGSFTTIQHFKILVPALERIKRQYGEKVHFKVIGDGNYMNEELGIQGIPWTKRDELKELQKIDIGVMPLPDDEWSNGKCGLKGLQYMALGIPTVMSPVGVNEKIIEDGKNGFLAKDDNEWVEKLSRLINDKPLRTAFGIKARQTVENGYSVNGMKEKYLHFFKEVI